MEDGRTVYTQEETDEVSPVKLADRLTLYQVLFTKFNQEGDGIWARFNILVAMNVTLFAAFGFVCFREKPLLAKTALAWSILVSGLLCSSWSMVVLRRLWKWHQHWRNGLAMIEQSFPDVLPRPHVNPPAWATADPGWGPRSVPALTQPFIGAIIAAWLLLIVLFALGRL